MLRPITEVAAELGIAADDLIPYGRDKAKVSLRALEASNRPDGKLVLVSAINPTSAGEGKTTTSIGLAMGLRRLGTKAVLALREPSLGPVFGVKGGATGGGLARIEPAASINLHFTGDLHAITAAHNLLAAMVDNALHFRTSRLDPRRVSWGRCLDMNDRSLRSVIVGLDGEGVPRETRFDITAASEVMAVLCLATDLDDLRARLGRIVVGAGTDGKPVTASELGAAEAMTALLVDALQPNLVQTLEGGPAFVHGGPFANIAHGCNSLLATRMALRHGDVVVTEAGFGFDLGAEKFLDIKCRVGGIWPDCVVIVATLRALRAHGAGGDLASGLANLERHLDTAAGFGLPAVVAINVFPDDTSEALAQVEAAVAAKGAVAVPCTGFRDGGAGGEALGRAVLAALETGSVGPCYTYDLAASYPDKLRAIAQRVYGADDLSFEPSAKSALERFDRNFPGLPVCVAKTQYSVSDDPKKLGRPSAFQVTVREARLAAGAGFVVALLGEMVTMPGLPKEPSALRVKVEPDGRVRGLMQEG